MKNSSHFIEIEREKQKKNMHLNFINMKKKALIENRHRLFIFCFMFWFEFGFIMLDGKFGFLLESEKERFMQINYSSFLKLNRFFKATS